MEMLLGSECRFELWCAVLEIVIKDALAPRVGVDKRAQK
jgi:hypothetical protein